MKKGTIIFITIAVIALAVALVVVAINLSKSEKNKEAEKQKEINNNQKEINITNSDGSINFAKAAEVQMAMPKNGETIATIHVKNYGDITVKFFDKIAPKAVEKFITHAKEGYYNGVIFHRVMNEFMIQGGDPTGTGRGGSSIWGEGFGTELDKSIAPYRGALCMAMSQLPNSLGSQFFISQANYNEKKANIMKQAGYAEGLLEMNKKYGGDLLSLYMKYTVFGQVISGMDVVDKIAAVETDSSDRPLTDVVIESIDVTKYNG